MKIGSDDISKIYLGSEEISKIYLGSEVIYEAEVTPPAPTGPVFELMQGHYISTDYDNAVNFLAGSGSAALTLDPEGYPSYTYNRLLLICSDWSDVRKLKITSQFDWRNGDVSVTALGQSVALTVSLSDSNKTLTCEIPSGVDRSTISGFIAIGKGTVAPNQSCTYSNFTVYDDNDNIIIPAS